jgi:hypothetical protein
MRRMFGMIAVAAVAGALFAAPVDAGEQKPLGGPMELTLFAVPCPDPLLPPFLTWAGTVEIDGTTFGFADFPTAPLIEDGKFMYFSEYWTMFRLEAGEAVTPEIACDATRVVAAGFNDGRGTPGMTAKADGTVAEVTEPGPLDDIVSPGTRMFWRGRVVGETGTEFLATFHLGGTH